MSDFMFSIEMKPRWMFIAVLLWIVLLLWNVSCLIFEVLHQICVNKAMKRLEQFFLVSGDSALSACAPGDLPLIFSTADGTPEGLKGFVLQRSLC
ncbi:uncharacterized [Tachysurus ichikawai]